MRDLEDRDIVIVIVNFQFADGFQVSHDGVRFIDIHPWFWATGDDISKINTYDPSRACRLPVFSYLLRIGAETEYLTRPVRSVVK